MSKSKNKIDAVSVITIFGGCVESIETFTENEDGNKEAVEFFSEQLEKHGASEDEIKLACDSGHYEVSCGKEEYVLIHS